MMPTARAMRPASPAPTPIPAWAPVLREPVVWVGVGLGVTLVVLLLAAVLVAAAVLVLVLEAVAVEREVDEDTLELLDTALAVMLK